MNSTLRPRPAVWLMLVGAAGLGLSLRGELAVHSAPAAPAANTLANTSDSASVAGDPGVQKIAAANTQFGFQMLHQLDQKAGGANVFFSPLSVSSALSVVLTGAGGATQTTLEKTLGLSGMTPGEVDRANGLLLPSLETDPKVQVSVANALWANQGTVFAPDFQARCRQFYQAQAETLNFASPEAAGTINKWVETQTHSKISQIVTPGDIAGSPAVITNAVYFHGTWQTPFEKSDTQDGPFTLPGGGTKTVPLMERSDNLSYTETEGFQAVSLPYGAGRMSFVVLLPKPGTGINSLISGLTPTVWADTLKTMKPTQLDLTLPRFKADYKAKLNEPLMALGMGPAFAPNADFAPMGLHSAFLGSVLHKAVLEVDEEGTVAAAVTGTMMETTVMRAPPKEMRVDHPFFCAIRDNETGTLLFAGIIRDPK